MKLQLYMTLTMEIEQYKSKLNTMTSFSQKWNPPYE